MIQKFKKNYCIVPYASKNKAKMSKAPIPSSWNSQKRKHSNKETIYSKKRNKTQDQSIVDINTLCTHLENACENAPDTISPTLNFCAEFVLQQIDYKSILQNSETTIAKSVPLLSKHYEEKFMRSPMHTETACKMGKECECMFLDPSQPFVAVKFDFPSVHIENEYCIFCLRKMQHLLFYKTIYRGIYPKECIQLYGNKCNEPGEYHTSAVIACPSHAGVQCMPFPIVAHQRNKYKVRREMNRHFVQQIQVAFEDFYQAPSPLKFQTSN